MVAMLRVCQHVLLLRKSKEGLRLRQYYHSTTKISIQTGASQQYYLPLAARSWNSVTSTRPPSRSTSTATSAVRTERS